MAASEAQLAANRANAQKSTGPKDTSKTRFNGIRHGLTATHSLLPWECKEDLQAIQEGFEQRFQPTDLFERLTIKHAAECFWRRERSARIEGNIFQTLAAAEHQKANAQPGELHYGHLEAIGFLRAREEFGHFRRYEAHLDRAYQKALAECEKLASLRTNKAAEPLPPPKPAERQERALLRPCALNAPLPKKARTVDVIGTKLTIPSEEKQKAA